MRWPEISALGDHGLVINQRHKLNNTGQDRTEARRCTKPSSGFADNVVLTIERTIGFSIRSTAHCSARTCISKRATRAMDVTASADTDRQHIQNARMARLLPLSSSTWGCAVSVTSQYRCPPIRCIIFLQAHADDQIDSEHGCTYRR